MKNIEKLGYLVGIAFPIYIGFDLHFEIGYWEALISLFGEGEQSAPFLIAHFIISTIFYSCLIMIGDYWGADFDNIEIDLRKRLKPTNKDFWGLIGVSGSIALLPSPLITLLTIKVIEIF